MQLALIRMGIVAVLLAVAVFYGYTLGVERESDRRDAADLQAMRQAERDYDVAIARGVTASRENLALRRQNRGYFQHLQEGIAHAKPQDLVLVEGPVAQGSELRCPQAASVESAGGPPVPTFDPGDIVVLFSGEYVRLYNAAWSGAGTAVPADPRGPPGDAQGAAPADPQEILTHTAAEAESCGEDRKRYARLINLLRQPPWSGGAEGGKH